MKPLKYENKMSEESKTLKKTQTRGDKDLTKK